jgi:hypothetical protein
MHVPASRLRPAGEPAGVSRIAGIATFTAGFRYFPNSARPATATPATLARKAPLLKVASVALTLFEARA